MADKQLARSGTVDLDVFSDDDPLAELARIVGYDNRPAVQQLQELERHREAVRREPVLDLEDELLREFDVYDAPHGGSSAQAPQPAVLEDHVAFAHPPASTTAVEPQIVDRVDHEALAFLPEPVAEFDPVPVEEPALFEPETAVAGVNEIPAADFSSHAAEPASAEVEHVWPVDQGVGPAFDGADLERELELSIGYDDYLAAAPVAVEQHFEAEPAIDDDAMESVEEIATSSEVDKHFVDASFESAESDMSGFETAAAEPDLPVWQPELPPVSEPDSARMPEPVSHGPASDGIDALLADIERFPVPTKAAVTQAIAPETVRKVNYPFTPTFSRATPVASNGGVLSQRAFATPLAVAFPAIAPETAYQPVETPVEPVVTEAAPALKAAIDQEPDFDLDTFELDLSGIDLEIDQLEPEASPEEPDFASAMAFSDEADDVAKGSMSLVDEVRQENEPPRDEPESALPFDPSMIAETEESLTTIADLNVPQLPVAEQERHVAQQPDYDLDIDAEMAQLFGTPHRSAAGTAKGIDSDTGFGSVKHAVSPAQSAGERPHVADDFDEFEKAMEEDFRLSLNQRQEPDTSQDRLAVGSGYAANNDYDEEGSGSGRRRLMLLAAAVTGLAIFGGAGVYAFMGGSGSALSGGEPQIILADKSPVKMVPVEKGGKTVPNQDKAVYDRVAGAQDATPQQGTLVSSTEEPIDVVQRTLTPETFPLEGAGDELPGLTPSDEDGERLLPDGPADANAAAEEDSVPAVSPRKVRTMIVKPDGTLVARDEPVAQPQTEVAGVAPAADQGEPQVKMVKTTSVTPQVETGSTPKSLPVAQEPAEQGQKSALAEAADVTVEEIAPVRPVKTTAVADANPVPQTRPVEEAKVVDTFKTEPVKQAEPAAEAKPVQTAAIAPGAYVVQIASLPSEAEAQKSYSTLSGKFGSVIGGKGVDIKRAEIAGKGTYYRVRIPAGSRDEANALCSRYKSAGGSCLVTK